jgi:SAM-dependent methyltransferase
VAALAPAPGERFLDLACGTGGVTLLAARRGADVTGLDLSADQLGKARTAAAEAGLDIRFDEGDAQALPYGDGSFDVLASTFGIIFAPDHERAAAELMRVLRPRGRVAITAWPEDDWYRLNRRLRPDYEGDTATRWSDETYVRGLLPELELRAERGTATIAAESPEALWELLAASVPPLKAWLATLDAAVQEDAKEQYLLLLAGGQLVREYVLILGQRR